MSSALQLRRASSSCYGVLGSSFRSWALLSFSFLRCFNAFLSRLAVLHVWILYWRALENLSAFLVLCVLSCFVHTAFCKSKQNTKVPGIHVYKSARNGIVRTLSQSAYHIAIRAHRKYDKRR